MKKIRIVIALIGMLASIGAFTLGASLPYAHAASVGNTGARCGAIVGGHIVNGHGVPYNGTQPCTRSIKIIPLAFPRGR